MWGTMVRIPQNRQRMKARVKRSLSLTQSWIEIGERCLKKRAGAR
jgi:hypothetical protein